MTTNEKRMVLVLVRMQNAMEEAGGRHAEAAYYDSMFDGGEFSGPAHAREYERALDRIAHRFGFLNADVAYAALRALRVAFPYPAHIYQPGVVAPLPR